MTEMSIPEPAVAESPPLLHTIGPVDHCPGCGGRDFVADSSTSDSTVFLCLGCGDGWRYELGYVWKVAPPASPAGHQP